MILEYILTTISNASIYLTYIKKLSINDSDTTIANIVTLVLTVNALFSISYVFYYTDFFISGYT